MQTSHIYQLHSMTHRGLLEEKERRKVLVGVTHPNLCLSQVAPPTQVMAAVRKSDSNFNLHQKCLFCFSLSSTRATPPSALCFIQDPESVLSCGSCRRCTSPVGIVWPRGLENPPGPLGPLAWRRVPGKSGKKDAFKSTVNIPCPVSRCTLWILKCLFIKRNKEMYSPFPRLHI